MPRLATLDENFDAPSSRIGNADDAYNYCYDVIQADIQRNEFRTHVQGLIDGNAPYRKINRDRTNLNFRQATAIITQFKVPYYDLLCEVPLLFEIETTFGKSEERSDWNQIMSEEFHRMVTSYEDWDETMQQCITQMLSHNIGHLFYENRMDWRPQPARMNEILVADQSPTRLSRLEAVVIRKGYMTTELMNFISDPEVAKEMGWNVKAVEEAVRDAYSASSMPPDRVATYEWFQQKRKNGDLYFGTYECERAWTAQLAVREYLGKDRKDRISTSMIRTDRQTGEFLYRNDDAYSSMEELINPFFYDIGDGTWHSGRGVGTEIFPYCQIFNKLRCREVDAAFIAASVMIQPQDGDAAKRAQMLTLDNLKILPAGVNFIEHAIGQNIEATLNVRRDMEAGMIQNIGGLLKAPGSSNPRKGQKQAIMEMQQAAQIGKGKINQFYSYMDRLGRTMFRKATHPDLTEYDPGSKESFEFQKRCRARGVPPQAFREIDFVKAYRSAGAGSSVNAIMALEAIKDLVPSFNEPSKLAYMRLLISRMLGTRTADMLVGEIKTKEKQTDDGWQAEIENAELRRGADGAKFFQDIQDHVIHAESHIKDMEEHAAQLQQAQQQQDVPLEGLMEVFTHIEAGGPHALQHLEQFKNDPIRKNEYKGLSEQWQQVAAFHDQLQHNIEQMQEERQRQEQDQQRQQPSLDALKGIDYNHAPESVKAQVEAALGVPRQQGDQSVQAQNIALKAENTRLKAAKQQQSGVIADVKTSHEIERHRKEMAMEG